MRIATNAELDKCGTGCTCQEPILRLAYIVLGGDVHVIPIDLVGGQNWRRPDELPAATEHEQPQCLRLGHVLEPFAEQPPAVLAAMGIPQPVSDRHCDDGVGLEIQRGKALSWYS
jgi:hypothetical protein